MTVSLSPVGGAAGQFFDSNGNPLAGGKLYTYAAGTTTPETTYTSSSGVTANSNPIIFNSAGRVPSEIWLTNGVAYKFSLYTSANQLIGTWDDVTGINSPENAFEISYTPPFTASVTTNVGDKLAETVSVTDFGATGDGVTDDTTAIQAAITYACTQDPGLNIFFPPGRYITTAPLNVTQAISITGVYPNLWATNNVGDGGGSWLFFNHAGVGVNIDNILVGFSGVYISNIGTRRNQPTPAPGWTPAANDYDFLMNNCSDVTFQNILLFNPTKGINAPTSGRFNFYNVIGQPLEKGIVIENAQDVCRFDGIHFWPFWNSNVNVTDYTRTNLDAIQLFRCDNPQMSNIFTIQANNGIRISQNANGTTSKLKVSNADFDFGTHGIYVDSNVNGASGLLTNVTFQGQGTTGSAESMIFYLLGSNCTYSLTNIESVISFTNAIRIEGTGNDVKLANVTIKGFDLSGLTFPAIEVDNNNYVYIANKPLITGSGGGAKYSGTGFISVDDWRNFTPTFVSDTGTITTIGTAKGQFKLLGNEVSVNAQLPIVTNGTAAGGLSMTLPFGTVLTDAYSAGSGREISVAGYMLQVLCTPGTTVAGVKKYDDTYPGGNGTTCVISFSYLV